MVNYEYFKNKTNGNLLIFCQSSPNISLRITLFNIYCDFYFLLFGFPNGLDQHGSRLLSKYIAHIDLLPVQNGDIRKGTNS